MFYFAASPGDRYSAAHEHFSTGFSFGKLFLLLLVVGIFAFFIYMGVKKHDK